MTAEWKAIKEAYQWEAKSQWKEAPPLKGDISVSITLYFGTKRGADLANFNKLSLDAITGIVYEDESQIAKMQLVRDYKKARPRIEINGWNRVMSSALCRVDDGAQYGE